MTKQSSVELAIVLIGGIMQKLLEYSEEQPEPDFVETSEIIYVSPPEPPVPPPDRPNIYEPVEDYEPLPDISPKTLVEF